MAEDFTKLTKDSKPQIPEALKKLKEDKYKAERQEETLVLFPETEDKEKIVKAPEKKAHLPPKGKYKACTRLLKNK